MLILCAAEIRSFASPPWAGTGRRAAWSTRSSTGGSTSSGVEEFACREPLVLNGQMSPARVARFDVGAGAGAACGRLASGGADGAVILWDVVAETGLFRLMGHRVPVTGVSFFRPGGRRGDRRADDLRRRLAR